MLLTGSILDSFLETRKRSETICAPLEIEDYVVQPVEQVSPPKWHLGHTSWFFEEFILKQHLKDYKEFDSEFSYVFNSYYETIGARVIRTDRGNMSRPSVKKVYQYRQYVTEHIKMLFENEPAAQICQLLEIGIHHEMQHQELLLTDIKYILGHNPLFPAYTDHFVEFKECTALTEWIEVPEGLYEIGHVGEGFCFDNELGRHNVFLESFEIANKLTTNAEYLEFIEAGGYNTFEYWHAAGWDWVNNDKIKAPLYWHLLDGIWHCYTLNGLQKLPLEAEVTHLSYYEAFAFAQWKECRLSTEFEWEASQEFFNWGTRWEWTESAYLPYPRFKKAKGALGEYNGKFMVNQKVLRGGSVATPPNHSRPSYRNFFHPNERWQYTGLRLAR